MAVSETAQLTGVPGEDEIQESVERRYARSPSDLLRLIVALVVAAIGFLLASVFDNLSTALTIETVEGFERLPEGVVVTLILSVQLLAWLVPAVVVVLLVWQHRYRRLGLIVFAATIAALMAWALSRQLISRFQPPQISLELPPWICSAAERTEGLPELSTVGAATDTAGALFRSQACVPGDAFPGTTYLAGFAGALGALTPWLTRRWRRAAWIALVLFLLVRTLDGVVVAVDAMLMLAVGYAVGAGTDLIFGSPQRHPTRLQVRTALARRGVEVGQLEPARVRARSSTPFLAVTPSGRRLFIKILSPDERAADLLWRVYRMIRFKGFGDERPASSLRRAVEHEAVMSLTAHNDGVRTPRLLAMSDVGHNSMLLVFDAVPGGTLAEIPHDQVNDSVQRAIWQQVELLRTHGLAHRNLGPHNILVDDEGVPWLLDFGFAEVSATEGELRNDVAELLVAMALIVGPGDAVANAAAGIGVEALRDAAPRLQPNALGSSIREELKAHKGLLKELREEVKAVSGIEDIQFEPLQRVKPSSLLTVAMLGLAFYFLIPQLAQVDLDDIAGADWTFLPLILLFSFATYLAAAVALLAAVPERLRFVEMLAAQLASSFFNRIAPAKVGGMAANVRYLQKSGVDPAVAVASVGVNNIAGVIVHITLTVVFLATVGRNAGEGIPLPSGQTMLYVLVGVLTAAGLVMVIPWGRQFFLKRVWPILRRAGGGIATVVENPLRMATLFGGSVMISGFYIMTLWYSIEAFGGGVGFVSVAAVFFAGTAIAQAAPTPGGVGAAEAALIAGLTAFGLGAAVAVPAVFLYRIATFWFPVLPGWLSYRALAKRGAF
jgi:undecaprenyl-diphosphatase